MIKIHYILILIFCLTIVSCGKHKQDPKKEVPDVEMQKKQLEYMNKKMLGSEDRQIEGYIDRYGWKVITTGTGLRIGVYEEGKGEIPVFGERVCVEFEVKLIDGTPCYSSKEQGKKCFFIQKSDEINGLHEALMMMKRGSKAKLIVPAHLAFGLMGDRDKIPLYSTLVYDIYLLN